VAYVKPTKAGLVAAFTAHGLNFVVDPVVASAEGRPWIDGIRAVVNHHTAGKSSHALLLNSGGRFPTVNALIQRDGVVRILSTLSVWGSGEGGPWPGVAAVNSLHLVGWQIEVEDMGMGKTFTDAQMESLGRMTAALVSLGVPLANVINHRDWTDGTAPVGGFPLPTRGRKVDTRYSGEELRANARKYARRAPGGWTRVTRFRRTGVYAGKSEHTPRVGWRKFCPWPLKPNVEYVAVESDSLGRNWLKTPAGNWIIAAATAYKP
jgi:hypothetical protein